MKIKKNKPETQTQEVRVQSVNDENKETDNTVEITSPAATENTVPAKPKRKFSPKAAAKTAARPFVWFGRKLRAFAAAVQNSRRNHPAGWKRAALIALTVLLVANVAVSCVTIAFSVRARNDSDWAANFANAAYDNADALRTESESVIADMNRSMTDWENRESIYSGEIGENLRWEVDPESATLKITGVGAMDKGFGESVRPAFSMLYRDFIRNLVVCDKVTSIAPYAFSGFPALETVTLGSGVETIGEHAFENCDSLCCVNLNKSSLREIGEDAFADCTELGEIELPDTYTEYHRFLTYHKTKLTVSEENEAFRSDGTALFSADGKTMLYCTYEFDDYYGESNDYTIPDGVEELAYDCMLGCVFNHLTVPGSVRELYIQDTGVQNVNRLTLGEGVESLRLRSRKPGEWESERYTWVQTAELPDSLTHIDEYVCTKVDRLKFSPDSKLLKLDAEGSVYSADGKTLLKVAEKDGRESYTVRDGVERIGNGATQTLYLYGGTLKLPKTLKSIGNDNFCCITILEGKTLTLPEGLERIGDDCFQNLTAEKMTIPSSVTRIGANPLLGSDNTRCSESGCTEGTLTLVYNGSASEFERLVGDTLPNGVVVEYAD